MSDVPDEALETFIDFVGCGGAGVEGEGDERGGMGEGKG